MALYSALRPLLFRLDPEQTHEMTLALLSRFPCLITRQEVRQPIKLMGLDFPNRLGLAAGLDKNGIAIAAFDRMGFGFIEVGTVTPRPQKGNEKPRLFRLPEHQAIINRMGFNNAGVTALVEKVAAAKANSRALIGINLGKNKDTPNENALEDYRIGMEAAYAQADYLCINISSPNTAGLRDLQHGEALKQLLNGIKEAQSRCQTQHQRYVPIVVKIAPDNDDAALQSICRSIADAGIDGIIASNTTIDKSAVQTHRHGNQQGGLSGAPLTRRSTQMLQLIRAELPHIPLIAAGGVMSGADFAAKLAAGADLVQIYTGLIYRGPSLIRECLQQTAP